MFLCRIRIAHLFLYAVCRSFQYLSIVLVSLSEDVFEVFDWFAFLSDLELQWHEHIATRLSNIDLDSTNDADFDIWDFFHDSIDIHSSDFVHGICKLCHWLLSRLNLFKVGLQCLSDIHELVIESVRTLRYNNASLFVILHFPLVLLEPQVCIDGGAARIVLEVLAGAIELAKFSVFRNANVRTEKNHQVASSWHVRCERVVANLADEWNASEPSHVEALASDARQSIV